MYLPTITATAHAWGGKLPPGVETADLIQQGYFACDRAITAYNPARGSFVTLLATCLRHEFARYCARQAHPEVSLDQFLETHDV